MGAQFATSVQTQVATATQLGMAVVASMFNAVFSVIQNLMPYMIGIVVLVIIISVAWRFIRHARGS